MRILRYRVFKLIYYTSNSLLEFIILINKNRYNNETIFSQ